MKIGSTDYGSALSLIEQTSGQANGRNSAIQEPWSTDTASGTSGPASSVEISKPGQLFGKLQSLAESDPAKFKELMADAATKLKSAAENSTNSDQQKFLTDLASKFQKASETGDTSAIKPEHHGGHRRGQGGAAGSYGQPPSEPPTRPDSSTGELLKSVFESLESAVSA
jgi:hypothetical protein